MRGEVCLRVQLLLALVSCLWLPGAGEGTEGGPSKGECRPPDRIAIRTVFLSVPQTCARNHVWHVSVGGIMWLECDSMG